MLLCQYFTSLKRCHFKGWYRFVVTLLLFIFSDSYFGQTIAHNDSAASKIYVASGAQIFSSDVTFNDQITNADLNVKESVRRENDSEVLLIISAQSISVEDNSKQAGTPKRKLLKKKTKNVTIVNLLAVTNANSKKYNFKNKSSHPRSFSRSYEGRVFLIIDPLKKQYSDPAAIESVVFTKDAQVAIYQAVFCSYNSRAYEFGFSNFYSVRPPPSV